MAHRPTIVTVSFRKTNCYWNLLTDSGQALIFMSVKEAQFREKWAHHNYVESPSMIRIEFDTRTHTKLLLTHMDISCLHKMEWKISCRFFRSYILLSFSQNQVQWFPIIFCRLVVGSEDHADKGTGWSNGDGSKAYVEILMPITCICSIFKWYERKLGGMP